MMVAENQDPHRTAYTVTVDYRHGAYVVLYKCTHILKNAEKAPRPEFPHMTVL